MYPRLQRLLILTGVPALLAACDPNVVIGAKWRLEQPAVAGGAGSGVMAGGAGAVAAGGTEAVAAGTSGASEAGSAGAGGEAGATEQWCATSPWVKGSAPFTGDSGNVIAAGSYLIKYVSGAQIHDLDIGYEVTDWYYGKSGLEAGHHVYSGESPATGATSLWLDETGIVSGGSIEEVEAANRGHTWPLEHAGGELFITLYDDDYGDNSGPGVRFCVTAAQ